MAHYKKWTPEEDAVLIRKVEVFPHKMKYCFTLVAEEIGRTPGAVAYRWYNVVSKMPDVFTSVAIRPHSMLKNRSRGEGIEIRGSLWNRVLRIVRNFFN